MVFRNYTINTHIRYSIKDRDAYFSSVFAVKHSIIFEVGGGEYLYIIQLNPNDIRRDRLKTHTINIVPILPLQVIHDINANLCKLVFDFSCETVDCTSASSNKHNLCDFILRQTQKHYNLSKNQIAVITGNVKAFRDVPYTVCLIERVYSWIEPATNSFVNEQLSSIKHNTVRKYKIACLMNKARYHRVKLAQELFSNNLLENNMVSLNFNKNQLLKLQQFSTRYDQRFDSLIQDHDDFLNSLPWKYDDFDITKTFYSPSEDTLSLNSYVNFVSESIVDFTAKTNSEYELDISEKTYKPIARLQPFVIFGQHGILEYLHSVGYKTFDQWWDESYDTISNSEQRLEAVLDIVKTISGKSPDALASMMLEMLPILEHNKNVFNSYVADKKHLQEFSSVILSMFDK